MTPRPAKRRRGIITNPIRYTKTLALGKLPPKHPGRRWEAILYKDPCPICGVRKGFGRKRAQMGIDHVQPKSKGGRKEPDNIVGMCHRCNNAKSNVPLLHYLLERA